MCRIMTGYSQAVQTDDGIVGSIFVLSEIDRDIDRSRALDNQEEPRTKPRTVLEPVLEPALGPRTVPEEPTKKTEKIKEYRRISTKIGNIEEFWTPHINREPNRGRFQNRFWEPRKEPRKFLDSKTGTENRTGTENLAPPGCMKGRP